MHWNQLKIDLWERFLGNWKDDNLYSEQDEELRSKTQKRINFWQKREQQAVKQQKKPAAFTLSGEDALKKLRVARTCKICTCRAPTWEKPTCTMPDFVTPKCPMVRSTTMTASDWSINKHCFLILHSKHLKHFMLLGNVWRLGLFDSQLCVGGRYTGVNQ